jgi:hypothetical protein
MALPGHLDKRLPWQEAVQRWLGHLCFPLLPAGYLAKVIADYYVDQEPRSFLKRAVRQELAWRYYRSSEGEKRHTNRRHFWGATTGVHWHEGRRLRYQDTGLFHKEYLGSRRCLLEHLAWLLDHFPCIRHLCEIGTGNGLLVEYLARRLDQIERFHGIDLSAEQIARNRAACVGSKVEFLHVEATAYLRQHFRPGTLFVACGTFECFTQVELEEFLALAHRSAGRVAISICDAIDVDYDAEAERASRPRGNLLYNHNYRYLLEKHGYQTRFCQLESPKPIYNRLTMLATSFTDAEVSPRTRTTG